MIKGFVNGQVLKVVTAPIVSDTVNYLEAEFEFVGEAWNDPGLLKYAFFKQGDANPYKIELINNAIRPERGIDLPKGVWEVSIIGEKFGDDSALETTVVTRITTTSASVTVAGTWTVSNPGGPFPEYAGSVGEQVVARATAAASAAGQSADEAAQSAVSATEDAGYADEAAELARDWAIGDHEHSGDSAKHFANEASGYARGTDMAGNPLHADVSAQHYAQEAATAASSAAADVVEQLEGYADQAIQSADEAAQSAIMAGEEAGYAEEFKDLARDWAIGDDNHAGDSAKHWSETAQGLAEISREYAEGKKLNGTDVGPGETGYHNNAKYYAEQAAEAAQEAAEDEVSVVFQQMVVSYFDPFEDYAVGDFVMRNDYLWKFVSPHTAGNPWNADEVIDVLLVEVLQSLTPIEQSYSNVTTLTIDAPPTHVEKVLRLTTAANGAISITFPPGTKFVGIAPVFGNSEEWEISLQDGVAVCGKVVSV